MKNFRKKPKKTQEKYRNNKKKQNKNIRKYSDGTECRFRIDPEKAQKSSITYTKRSLWDSEAIQKIF